KRFQEKIDQGETVYLLGFQGIIQNSGLSLIEASKNDGIKVLANYEEERLAGEKHYAGYPGKSVIELKKHLFRLGKTTQDIFCVLYGWDLIRLEKKFQELKMARLKLKCTGNKLDDYMLLSVISQEAYDDAFDAKRKNFYVYSPLLVKIYYRLMDDLDLINTVPCIQMLHHENHAYFSYGVSPFSGEEYLDQTTMVACIDGNGDLSSSSLYRAKGTELELIKRLGFSDSLGNFYGLLASFLGGWSPMSAEGRYMGAAAWGNSNRLTNPYYKRLRQYFYFSGDGDLFVNSAMVENEYKALQDIVGPFLKVEDLWNPDAVLNVEDVKHSEITRERVDKAAAVQLVFEDTLFHIIGDLIQRTQSDQLVLCGGAALNCVANMRLLEHFNRDYYQRYLGKDTQLHLWIPPIPSDQGVVAGAPYQFAMRNGVRPRGEFPTPFICGVPPCTSSIHEALKAADFVCYEQLGNINNKEDREKVVDWMAYSVSQNGVIGIFQGAAETGPRALGNRSLLSNPCNPDSMVLLNSRVKLRECIRPLAPMVTLDEAEKWFKLSKGGSAGNYDAYNYMVLTVEAKEEAREMIPAVIHYDGTCRIQIVRKENNLIIYEYLKALKKYIGVEVSINTSLNVGSPIVQTPGQALLIFKRSKGLDGIFMISEEGDAFVVWAKDGIQEFNSRITALRPLRLALEK
ncbi:MAG: carbamoyltransferase, partial [SAR324 cluster bacterium]|nr:carbamoyltransferase [SAR324 cluster bacterium]